MILQEIFDIISNMNKKEKSFFVRYAKMYSNDSDKRHYILLYDKIYQQTQDGRLNEKKLLKQIGSKIDLKNYSNYKRYLHQQLLQSLVIHHKNANSSMAINNAIQTIRVLYSKGLTSIGSRLLKKTKVKAKRLEDFGNLIYIINLQSNVTASKNNSYHLLKTERDLAIQQYDQINELHLFNERCFDLNVKECFFTLNDPRFKELYNNPLLADETKLLSNKAKAYFCMTKSLLLFMACQFEKARSFQYKILEIIEKQKIIESTLITVYQNIIYQSLFMDDFETYHFFADKMQKKVLETPSPFNMISHQRTLLFYYRIAQKHQEGMDLLDIIGPEYLEQTNRPLNLLESFLVTEVIPYLCTVKEYAIALNWINYWHNLPASNFIVRYKLVIKVLEIIVHLELNNFLLIPHLLNSLKRELKKQISIGGFERALIDFFNKSSSQFSDNQSYQNLIQSTLIKIENIGRFPKNTFWFQFFDFKKYLQQKLQQPLSS